MEVSNLIYSRERISSALSEQPDKSVIATKSLQILFPKRYEDNNFASVGEEVSCVGMFGVVVEGKYYAPIGVLMRFVFGGGELDETVIDGVRYIVIQFEPGDVVIKRLISAVENMMGYYYYMEFSKYCNIPWYFDYKKILEIFDETGKYTGKAFSDTNQCIRVIYALVCRDPTNLDVPFRYSPLLENESVEPHVIGVNNPGQLLTDIFSRYSGGYMAENTDAALLDTEDREATGIEKILKGIPNE